MKMGLFASSSVLIISNFSRAAKEVKGFKNLTEYYARSRNPSLRLGLSDLGLRIGACIRLGILSVFKVSYLVSWNVTKAVSKGGGHQH